MSDLDKLKAMIRQFNKAHNENVRVIKVGSFGRSYELRGLS